MLYELSNKGWRRQRRLKRTDEQRIRHDPSGRRGGRGTTEREVCDEHIRWSLTKERRRLLNIMKIRPFGVGSAAVDLPIVPVTYGSLNTVGRVNYSWDSKVCTDCKIGAFQRDCSLDLNIQRTREHVKKSNVDRFLIV